jgi:ATP-binding cassette subfamily C (CFTR/MRP) protein 4
MFQRGVRQSAEMENQMVSVERILEYTKLQAEASLETPPGQRPPPSNWPDRGEIIMKHLQLEYLNEDPILRNINCVIRSSEKVCFIQNWCSKIEIRNLQIGIVGRTGAGSKIQISKNTLK